MPRCKIPIQSLQVFMLEILYLLQPGKVKNSRKLSFYFIRFLASLSLRVYTWWLTTRRYLVGHFYIQLECKQVIRNENFNCSTNNKKKRGGGTNRLNVGIPGLFLVRCWKNQLLTGKCDVSFSVCWISANRN